MSDDTSIPRLSCSQQTSSDKFHGLKQLRTGTHDSGLQNLGEDMKHAVSLLDRFIKINIDRE
jgi:hypothetical protein